MQMQITAKDGTGLNTERLAQTSKDMATAARNFTNTLVEIAAAVVETMDSIDWKALGAAMAADSIDWKAVNAAMGVVDTGRPDAEPDENPVRFIGIRKGGWKRERRREYRKCGL
jgi:peptide deformylase